MGNNKHFRTWLITIGAVIIVLAVVYALMEKRISWVETYEPDDLNPYGTSILYNLFAQSQRADQLVNLNDSLALLLPPDPTDAVDNYFYIGNQFWGDSADMDAVLKFVEAGNNAFLVLRDPGNSLFDSLLKVPNVTEYEESFEDSIYVENPVNSVYTVVDSTVHLELLSSPLNTGEYPVSLKYKFKTIENFWPYFSDSLRGEDAELPDVLGDFDEGYHNYIRVPHGKGYVYFHSTPLVFTNYYMLNDTAMNYCRTALQYFGKGNIYWDEDSRSYDPSDPHQNAHSGNPNLPSKGPLEFIITEPSLRIAWYLLMLGAVFYMLFGAKRKQRVIPAMEIVENSSIEYTQVLSQMFMKQKDHKKLVVMKMDLFKTFLRDRYQLRLPAAFKEQNDAFYKEVSYKSKASFEDVKGIFEDYKVLSAITQVETEDMFDFHQKLVRFYNAVNK